MSEKYDSLDEMDGARRGWRVATKLKALFTSDREDGEGVLTDISYTGALFRSTTIRPSLGKRVRVFLCFENDAGSLQLEGEVIRQTEDGFAIEYQKPNEQLQLLVDDAAAIVALVKNSKP